MVIRVERVAIMSVYLSLLAVLAEFFVCVYAVANSCLVMVRKFAAKAHLCPRFDNTFRNNHQSVHQVA